MIKGQLADIIYQNEVRKLKQQFPHIEMSEIRPSRAKSQRALTQPEVWFEKFLNEKNLSYEYKTSKIILNNEAIKDDELLAHISLFLLSNQVKITKSQIKDTLLVWKSTQEKGFIKNLRSNFAYKVNSRDFVSDWVWASTGRRNQMDIAAMKHFIWQIKRKLFGLPIENHLMPVLFGKSGGGKSVAVSLLLSPLKSVTLNSDMGLIEDQLFKKALGKNYIVFFDELAGSNKVDVNRLKQIITAEQMEWRGIRSENMVSGPQNCTFIGCSNLPVVRRIQDPTSMRRFWQLTCEDKINWNLVNSIDYQSLWTSIDEQGDSPILSCLHKVQRAQEEMRRSSVS